MRLYSCQNGTCSTCYVHQLLVIEPVYTTVLSVRQLGDSFLITAEYRACWEAKYVSSWGRRP